MQACVLTVTLLVHLCRRAWGSSLPGKIDCEAETGGSCSL